MKFRILLAAMLALFAVHHAEATTAFPFSATVVGGPFAGTVGTGTFSYDETTLIVGNETLDPAFGDLTIDFTIFAQLFTEADDIDYDGFPEIFFASFTPIGMDFLVSEDSINPTPINKPHVISFRIFDQLVPANRGGFATTMSVLVESVPEPAAATILLQAALILGVWRRRA